MRAFGITSALSGGSGEDSDAGVRVVRDGPAALVDEVVMVQTERYAVVDVGVAVVLPPFDVVNLKDAPSAVGESAPMAMSGVDGAALRDGHCRVLRPTSRTSDRPA